MRHTTKIDLVYTYETDGTPCAESVYIITDAADLGYTGQDTEWWEDYTQRLHDAKLALAALPPEQRDEALRLVPLLRTEYPLSRADATEWIIALVELVHEDPLSRELLHPDAVGTLRTGMGMVDGLARECIAERAVQ
jgi:hypothetical protein